MPREAGGGRRTVLRIMGRTDAAHVPVLAGEVLEILRPRPGGLFLDATLGAGGHSGMILEAASPDGRVLAFDRDERAIAEARRNLQDFGDRIEYRHEDFRRAPATLAGEKLDGVVADLGVSSMQLDDPEAGFSFSRPGPLDMRMDRRGGPTAADLVNGLEVRELADILRRYGEERRAGAVARAIAKAREEAPLTTTEALARVVLSAFSAREQHSMRIHPATRTFQALRIAVNDELSGLDAFIEEISELLRPGACIAVISFHSLEDRIVKQTLRRLSGGEAGSRYLPPDEQQPLLRLLTRKPIRPGSEEIECNPRSRSARLRAAERLTREEADQCAS